MIQHNFATLIKKATMKTKGTQKHFYNKVMYKGKNNNLLGVSIINNNLIKK